MNVRLHRTCRGCLVDVREHRYSFKSKEIRDLYSKSTSISLPLASKDPLPRQICKECYTQCRKWKEFKSKCVESGTRLLVMIRKCTVLVESVEIVEPVFPMVSYDADEEDYTQYKEIKGEGFEEVTVDKDDVKDAICNLNSKSPDEEENEDTLESRSCELLSSLNTHSPREMEEINLVESNIVELSSDEEPEDADGNCVKMSCEEKTSLYRERSEDVITNVLNYLHSDVQKEEEKEDRLELPTIDQSTQEINLFEILSDEKPEAEDPNCESMSCRDVDDPQEIVEETFEPDDDVEDDLPNELNYLHSERSEEDDKLEPSQTESSPRVIKDELEEINLVELSSDEEMEISSYSDIVTIEDEEDLEQVIDNCPPDVIIESPTVNDTEEASNRTSNWSCPFCPDNTHFKDYKKCRKHMKENHMRSDDNCSLCHTKHRTANDWIAHVVREHMPGKWDCTICQLGFESRNDYRVHVAKKHTTTVSTLVSGSEELDCILCWNTFTGFERFKEHIISCHFTGTPEIKCKECDVRLRHVNEILDHLFLQHIKKSLSCGDCGFTAKNPSEVVEHIRNAHNVDRITCTICGKQPANFTKHLIQHDPNLARFVCVALSCDKACSTETQLKTHLKTMHKGYTNFQCAICDKGFVKLTNFTRHNVIHARDTLHECRFCGVKFGRLGSLTAHLAVHMKNRTK